MNEPLVGVHTIGQTPRPDLTEQLAARFTSVRLEVTGALDDLSTHQVPACQATGYPLETRLRDGTHVLVDAAFLEPRLQDLVSACDDRVVAHLVLCAGPFPLLKATRTLIRPFDVAVEELAKRNLEALEVVVPFAAQATPSSRRWEAEGFQCRIHVLSEMVESTFVAQWLSGRLDKTGADALVFDYVGFPSATLAEVAAKIDLPVLDLGLLALDALERTLQNAMRQDR